MNLTVTLGRDNVIELVALRAGQRFPLKNSTIIFSAKLNQDPSSPYELFKTNASGITIVEGTDNTNRLSIELLVADLVELSALTSYFWDILVVDPDGKAFTPDGLSGELTVEASVTMIPTS